MNKWKKNLIEVGVTKDHIESMKSRVLESNSEYLYYYDYYETEKQIELVPTEKINGINTGWHTENRSVYELFFSNHLKTEKPLKYSRIKENYNSLINNGLRFQYDFYQNISLDKKLRDGLPKFTYYEQDDKYFSGATHRTVSAIMFNAPYMVGYLYRYKRNENKYNSYIVYRDYKKKWNDFKNKNFDNIEMVIKKSKYYNDRDSIILKLKESEIELLRFNSPVKRLGEVDLSDRKKILLEGKIVKNIMKKLNKIDKNILNYKKRNYIIRFIFFIEKHLKAGKVFPLLFEMIYYKYRETNYCAINMDYQDLIDSLHRKITYNIIKGKTEINVL